MNSKVKTIIFWVFIIACLVLLWNIVQKSTGLGAKDQKISFSTFMTDAQQGLISDVTVVADEVHGHYRNKTEAFSTTVPANYPDMYKTLQDEKVSITVNNSSGNSWLPILINFSPLLALFGDLVLHGSPDAERRQQGNVVRQEPRPPALHAAEEGHVQGRSRRG